MPSTPPSVITIEHDEGIRVRRHHAKSRTSSGGSAHTSGGSGFSTSTGSSGWTDLGEDADLGDVDEIEPSDSASRSRGHHHSSRRYTTEGRPVPTRRHSSRRIIDPAEDPPRRHHSSRRHTSGRPRRVDSHRAPSSDDSSSLGNVAYPDEYPPQGHHGMPPPPQMQRGYPGGFRHVPAPGHGGFPPSIATSGAGYPDGYTRQALVHMPQPGLDGFGYPPAGNPFGQQDPVNNPFSPMSQASGSNTSYFNMDPHAPSQMGHNYPPQPGRPRPQSFAAPSSYHGSEMMSPYAQPPMMPFPGYPGMPPMSPYAMHPWYAPPPPPSTQPSPAPPADNKKGEEQKAIYEAKLEALLKKAEEERAAFHKEQLAKAEAEAAAKAREEEEKRKKEEIADAAKKAKEAAEKKAEEASKKAKEDHEKKVKELEAAKEEAEKKAKEEHEKKVKELEAAKEEAEKKQKAVEEENEKLKPPDFSGKSIKFKDAVGRKFSFPYHLCKTWKGMESLIKQAFLQIDVIGEHVRQGHYDLTGPDQEIILPQVWENMVKPDWEVEMHMWPMPEEENKKKKKKVEEIDDLMDPLAAMGLADLGSLGIVDPGAGKKAGKTGGKTAKDLAAGPSKRKSRVGDANIITVGPDGPVPPPARFPPGVLPDPLDMAWGAPPGVEIVKEKPRADKGKSKSRQPTGLAAWFAGGSGAQVKRKK